MSVKSEVQRNENDKYNLKVFPGPYQIDTLRSAARKLPFCCASKFTSNNILWHIDIIPSKVALNTNTNFVSIPD